MALVNTECATKVCPISMSTYVIGRLNLRDLFIKMLSRRSLPRSDYFYYDPLAYSNYAIPLITNCICIDACNVQHCIIRDSVG